MSSDSFSTYRPSQAASEFTYPSSRPSVRNFDRYEDKHVSRSHSRGTAHRRRYPSIDSSREIDPHRPHFKNPDFEPVRHQLVVPIALIIKEIKNMSLTVLQICAPVGCIFKLVSQISLVIDKKPKSSVT